MKKKLAMSLVLLTAAGRPLSDLQRQALQELAGQRLTLYFFSGIDEVNGDSGQAMAASITATLCQAGLQVATVATSWPDLASRAINGKYDILLLPATSNSRLPRQVVILEDPAQPAASAWITGYRQEVYIVSRRLTQLTINPYGHPFAAAAGSWTCFLEDVRFLAADGSYLD